MHKTRRAVFIDECIRLEELFSLHSSNSHSFEVNINYSVLIIFLLIFSVHVIILLGILN